MISSRALRPAVLILGLALPGMASAQTPAPSDQPKADSASAAPTPRVTQHGPLVVRFYGGYVGGMLLQNLSGFTVDGFTIVAGVAFPLGDRKAMEITTDVAYSEYTGGFVNPGVSRSISVQMVALSGHFLYNFARQGRSSLFAGGGLSIGGGEVHMISIQAFPPFLAGRHESRNETGIFGLQGVGGAQFAAGSKMSIRAEGRLLLNYDGIRLQVLGGISF